MQTIQLTASTIDLTRSEVLCGEKSFRLSAMETKLVQFLVQYPNQVLSRERLLSEVWGYKANLRTRTDHATILRLRNKIELDPSNPIHLHTVRGVGYKFKDIEN